MKLKSLLLIAFVAVSAQIINAQTVDPSKVLTFMEFNGNTTDASNNNVTYALHSGEITYQTGKFGQAGAFNNAALVSTGLGFDPVGDFTIAAWINMNELASVLGAGHTWIHQFDGGGAPGRIHLEVLMATDNISNFTSGIRLDATEITAIVPNTWYHAVVVNNTSNSTCALYIDGVKVGEVLSGTESTNTEVAIGARKQLVDANRANGLMDELLITTQVLDDAAISYIMTNGVAAAMLTTAVAKVDTKTDVINYYNNGSLNINFKNDISAAQYAVYSIAGKRIANGYVNNKTNAIEMNLAKGVYIVKLNADNKQISKKFIVQ